MKEYLHAGRDFPAEELARNIYQQVDCFSDGIAREDDLTVVGAKVC